MLMHDFYAGFSLEEPEEKVRKDGLDDSVLRGINDCRDRKEIAASFDISDARAYLTEMNEKHGQCDRCLVNIEKNKEIYIITLVPLDKKNRPLKTTVKEALGKKIRAAAVTEETLGFMDGKNSVILTLKK